MKFDLTKKPCGDYHAPDEWDKEKIEEFVEEMIEEE